MTLKYKEIFIYFVKFIGFFRLFWAVETLPIKLVMLISAVKQTPGGGYTLEDALIYFSYIIFDFLIFFILSIRTDIFADLIRSDKYIKLNLESNLVHLYRIGIIILGFNYLIRFGGEFIYLIYHSMDFESKTFSLWSGVDLWECISLIILSLIFIHFSWSISMICCRNSGRAT